MRDDDVLQQQETSHISYKDYKKIVNSNKKQSLRLFLWAFFVLLLIFLGMAKLMSPDVEITLGDDNYSAVESDEINRSEMDDRLKQLQMEDDFSMTGDESLSIEDGGKVSIPKKDKDEAVENKLPEETLGQKAVKDRVGDTVKEAPTPQEAPVPAPAPVVPTVIARVIVGNYPTPEQAEVAKGILQEAGLGVTPFVRKMNGAYTLQVASYGSKEKALSVAESLLNQNFPAKVIVEYK